MKFTKWYMPTIAICITHIMQWKCIVEATVSKQSTYSNLIRARTILNTLQCVINLCRSQNDNIMLLHLYLYLLITCYDWITHIDTHKLQVHRIQANKYLHCCYTVVKNIIWLTTYYINDKLASIYLLAVH